MRDPENPFGGGVRGLYNKRKKVHMISLYFIGNFGV